MDSRAVADNRGFTIVEVIIVLAIAGLILMLIFLAIPTLIRNSNNSARKQDVAAVLQAVSRYGLNNGGNYPPANCAATLDTCYLYPIRNNLTQYATTDINVAQNGPRQGDSSNSVIDSVVLKHYYKCAANGVATSKGAGYRDIVALFAIEKSGGATAPQCQQL